MTCLTQESLLKIEPRQELPSEKDRGSPAAALVSGEESGDRFSTSSAALEESLSGRGAVVGSPPTASVLSAAADVVKVASSGKQPEQRFKSVKLETERNK